MTNMSLDALNKLMYIFGIDQLQCYPYAWNTLDNMLLHVVVEPLLLVLVLAWAGAELLIVMFALT